MRSTNKLKPGVCRWSVAVLGMFCVATALAHHSGALFDQIKTLAITGTVKEWLWANPHCWVYLTVTRADGKPEEWAFEGDSPNVLSRKGWTAYDIAVGDKLTVDSHPARDGTHQGILLAIYLPNGKRLEVLSRPGSNGTVQSQKPQGEVYK